ncbi:gametocyte-specific factor 1-like [Galleria mellonella]|uniref:Gametocyte-specific factor 1-like n=1 Tax=Galleria mellonella TaxID=7137 RepID=A0A6J1WJI1_GALME|nr:gametocyte-specific factor 1-like [Galleria mellonella]XP_052754365.1 gametocyte-specific factor 1-like [Galleria mellonella]
MDDPFVTCPYNACHRVSRSRIQAHLVKCQKNYPKLDICPYNATHRMSSDEMKQHVKICTNRSSFFLKEKPLVTGAISTPKRILQKEYLPETDPNHEMWDD